MGWLFAVALGLQEERVAAVWNALGPLAVGHAAAVALTLAVAWMVGLIVPLTALKWIVSVVLLTLGIYRLLRHRHPRYGGMRVGPAQLTFWSFLMAGAHGAGLMVVPVVFSKAAQHHHGSQLLTAGISGLQADALGATLLHTAAYLLVTGAIAVVVYQKLGLRLLQRMWINVNVIWAIALIITAVVTPLL